jgi:hypothetical protein
MPDVLLAPSPLSKRAQAFLAEQATVVAVDTGPDDDQCRADMRAAFGRSDEHVLLALRRLQRRYSGLAYHSRFRGGDIVFQPVLEAGPDMDRIEFWYAVMDAKPDGCRSGNVLPDGTVWFGMFDRVVLTFPSLDHLVECDALLDLAYRLPCLSSETPPDATAYREILRQRFPDLRRIDRASGHCVEWWSDDKRLIYFNGLDARLASAGGTSPVPTVVRTWILDQPDHEDIVTATPAS